MSPAGKGSNPEYSPQQHDNDVDKAVTFMGSRNHTPAIEAGEGVASSAMAASAGDGGSSYAVDNATGTEQGKATREHLV